MEQENLDLNFILFYFILFNFAQIIYKRMEVIGHNRIDTMHAISNPIDRTRCEMRYAIDPFNRI